VLVIRSLDPLLCAFLAVDEEVLRAVEADRRLPAPHRSAGAAPPPVARRDRLGRAVGLVDRFVARGVRTRRAASKDEHRENGAKRQARSLHGRPPRSVLFFRRTPRAARWSLVQTPFPRAARDRSRDDRVSEGGRRARTRPISAKYALDHDQSR